MPLIKLQFKPGVFRDISSYTNTTGWYDSNLMRFRFGFPEPVGGWVKYSNYTFLGTNRSLHNWLTLGGKNLMSVGSNLKYYIEEGGFYYDVTPLRKTVSFTNKLTATDGSNIILVNDTGHGAFQNDFVTFSGASSLGGNITADILNVNQQVVTVVDANNYTIRVGATASSADTGNGGTITAKYEIHVGLDTQVGGTGWGSSTWSRGTWGSGSDLTVEGQLRFWTQDNFGENLIFNAYNGGIYYWAANSGTANRGVELSSLSSDPTVPTVARQIIVSDRDRHTIAFGCDNGDGIQDPLLIRFSEQENPFVWENVPTNSAGELRIGAGSEIIQAVETKREVVVFTDNNVHSMQYVGPPYTFGIQQIAANTSLIGPLAAVSVDDNVFWMGQNKFFVYSGSVQEVPCGVHDHVFNNLNYSESSKIMAAHNSQYGEVTWYYPTLNSSENDSYVTYNYSEKVWYYGVLTRTAWMDAGLRTYAIATTTDGYAYNHEIGVDADGTPITAFIESSPIELGEGDKFMLISRIIPDMTFQGSTAANPTVDLTLKVSTFPGADYSVGQAGGVNTVRTATVPIEQFTQYKDVRLRGRQVVLRVEKNTLGTTFTLGTPRLEVRPDGRR